MNDIRVMNIQRFSLGDGPGIRTTVFLKGCPLFCPWCSNPESQPCENVLMYSEDKCVKCGCCVDVCPEKAISILGNKLVINRTLCKACGNCSRECLNDALSISGYLSSADQIISTVLKDCEYYKISGGGLTISGGEPLMQANAVNTLSSSAKQYGISVAVETTANVPRAGFIKAIKNIDLLLIDFKSADKDKLKKYTGGDLELISDNIRVALEIGKTIIARIPVIPIFNHSENEIKNIFKELIKLGVNNVDLLPYHLMGRKKYLSLGMDYPYSQASESLDKDELFLYKNLGQSLGMSVTISGK